jgi:hypothetical protein
MEEKRERNSVLENLIRMEEIAQKKTKIYSRLLIDPALAGDMESLSMRHQKRREKLTALLNGEMKNADSGQNMQENGQESDQENGGGDKE